MSTSCVARFATAATSRFPRERVIPRCSSGKVRRLGFPRSTTESCRWQPSGCSNQSWRQISFRSPTISAQAPDTIKHVRRFFNEPSYLRVVMEEKSRAGTSFRCTVANRRPHGPNSRGSATDIMAWLDAGSHPRRRTQAQRAQTPPLTHPSRRRRPHPPRRTTVLHLPPTGPGSRDRPRLRAPRRAPRTRLPQAASASAPPAATPRTQPARARARTRPADPAVATRSLPNRPRDRDHGADTSAQRPITPPQHQRPLASESRLGERDSVTCRPEPPRRGPVPSSAQS